MTPEQKINQNNEIVDGIKKHIGGVSEDMLSGFIRGYKQGYSDAQYVYSKNTERGIEPGYSGEIDPRFAAAHYENDLYVNQGCGCLSVMYCDGGCFPKTKNAADWK